MTNGDGEEFGMGFMIGCWLKKLLDFGPPPPPPESQPNRLISAAALSEL